MELRNTISAAKLNELFNLRKGEEKTVIILFAFYFLQFFALAIVLVAASAIFLTAYSVSSLPAVFMLTGGVLIIKEVIYLRAEKRLHHSRLILIETIAMLALTVLFRFGLGLGIYSWLGIALIVGHRIMTELVLGSFSRMVLLLFDVRQSKRLLGLLSSAEIPANVVGYLLISLIAPLMGTEDLLWLAASAFALSFLLLLFVIARGKYFDEKDGTVSSAPSKSPKKAEPIVRIFGTYFVYSLSITAAIAMLVALFIEYSFLSSVDIISTTEQEIVFNLGVILGSAQLVAFLIQSFLYGMIQRRFGLKASLYVLPVALIVVTAASPVSYFFEDSQFFAVTIWIIIMLVRNALRPSLYNNSFISLLQPLTKKMKMDAFSIIGKAEVLAILIAGVLLTLFILFETDSLLPYTLFLLFMLIVWLRSIKMASNHYVTTLEEAVARRYIVGGSLQLNDVRTINLLTKKLKSEFPGEALYALDILIKNNEIDSAELLIKAIEHPLTEVRRDVYQRVVELKDLRLLPHIKARVEKEELPALKRLAIYAYCSLGETSVVDEVSPYLDSDDLEIQAGALVGMICFGGINGIIIAGQRLMENINSTHPDRRAFAAYVIGEVGIHNFYHPLLVLLDDNHLPVEREALKAAGKIRHPRLHRPMLKAVSSPYAFDVALHSLIKSGEEVVDEIGDEFQQSSYDPIRLRRLIYVCGRIGGPKSVDLLKKKLFFKDTELKAQVLNALSHCRYTSSEAERAKVLEVVNMELSDAAWYLNAMDTLNPSHAEEYGMLIHALELEVFHLKRRLLLLLSFLYNADDVLKALEILQLRNQEKMANALEILDVLLPKDLSSLVLPLLEDVPLHNQAKLFQNRFLLKWISAKEILTRLLAQQNIPAVNPWTAGVAIYLAHKMGLEKLPHLLERHQASNWLVRETIDWVQRFSEEEHESLGNNSVISHHNKSATMQTKLMPIEKVLALKTTELFKETAEDILVDIAAIIEEVNYGKGDLIFSKGDAGTCMYIIYQGSVKVHDGDHIFAEMRTRDFFGELSLLDAEPRSASVTTLEDSILLRIDQNAFYEILADRIEVTREIMKILCRRLRNQNDLVAGLKQQLTKASI